MMNDVRLLSERVRKFKQHLGNTSDDLDTVFAYFKEQLAGGGYKVSENRFSGPQGTGGMLVGESGDGRQSLTYTMQSADGKTQVSCMYSRKKG